MTSPATTLRPHGRAVDALRPVRIHTGALKFAEGSALIEIGDTRVLVAASIEQRVPPFLRDSGKGWITAEYAMLPRATHTRNTREVAQGRPSGRTAEIQRLIGRAIRSIVDMEMLGEKTIWLDCDVIEADGGTRTAAITGAYVALMDAIQALEKEGVRFAAPPVKDSVSAVSVGVFKNELLLDLCYEEDSKADVDMNVVKTSDGRFVEIQGTAEAEPFGTDTLMGMLALADKGITDLIARQRAIVGPILGR
jgi:ribonuclease PH